ncbi:lysophospholipid acyltransferase family protein [Phycisphaerales bacterium AB-hyl4]|uniref:Lysophospholipid acyltransferase family protein n=1 Tax=Natronomicrosphaera hydrolytica TaxID=3242702 RepID=A0ABV4U0Z0_9BACT
MTQPRTQPRHANLPRRSPRLLAMFVRYVRRYVGKQFNAVRVLRESTCDLPSDTPVVFYVNHPSWWDPLMLALLATQRYPQRQHYAPIDAAMLGKYAFFERLGFFGIEPNSTRGAAKLLRVGQAILAQPDAALWITAEGQFTDPRLRPVQLRPGLAHLARRLPHARIVPVAIEYIFWDESTPEALMAFGDPINTAEAAKQWDVTEWQRELAHRLERTMDRLATASQTRDPALFDNLLDGRRGIGGVYDLWRRCKAWARGQRFDPSHGGSSFDNDTKEAR